MSDFFLSEDNATDSYKRWRERKLSRAPSSIEELIVQIDDPFSITRAQRAKAREAIARANFALYVTDPARAADPKIPISIMSSLGVDRLDFNPESGEDGLTRLTPREKGEYKSSAYEYIPYSDRPISWHTDGYYNRPDRRIRSLALHCVRAARVGGANRAIDHEIVYILLRDQDPQGARALFSAGAMTIDARIENGKIVRPERAGHLFKIESGLSLSARYTHRSRYITWSTERYVQRGLERLRAILESQTRHHFSARLEPGWGLIMNNVFHTREGFKRSFDRSTERLLYRARYYDPIETESA